MGLLTTATSDNRIVDQALTVTYSKRHLDGYWSASTGLTVNFWNTAFEYHRYATIQYRYVGMDYNSAIQAANNIRNQYTRNYWISDWQVSGRYAGTFRDLYCGKKIQGSVEVVKTVGHIYEIQVNINEDDTRMSLTGLEYFNVMFQNENLRHYDY